MKGRKATRRIDLHESLLRKTFTNAVICTYSFEPGFFEDYALQRLAALQENNNISVVVDAGVYDSVVAGSLWQRPKRANIRYLLHPIRVPGVFHPKLVLLTDGACGRLILGSANFTRAGLTANAEMVAVYDYDGANTDDTLPIFRAAWQFLESLVSRHPSTNLLSNLEELRTASPWLLGGTLSSTTGQQLLHNLDKPLLPQLRAMVEPPVDSISVLSRYFDSDSRLLGILQREWRPREINIYTQNNVTTMTSTWLADPLVTSGQVKIRLGTFSEPGTYQPLHAKAIAFSKAGRLTLVFGSANFTSSALLFAGTHRNVETIVVLSDLSADSCSIEDLFDPNRNSVHLTDPADLISSPPENDEPDHPKYDFSLSEAYVEGNNLTIDACVPPEHQNRAIQARLEFPHRAYQRIEVLKEAEGRYSAQLSDQMVRRISEASTLVRMETKERPQVISSWLLVVNLLDLETGHAVRADRRIREAISNPSQFFAYLDELTAAGDDGALLRFLSFCEIPISHLSRSPILRGRPQVGTRDDAMKNLGYRNFKLFLDLHDAVLYFFDRHLRKLKRHVERLELDGVSNFLHIALTMGGLLRNQMERAIFGLEAKDDLVTATEWSDFRLHCDIYLAKWRDLLACLRNDYLASLLREHDVHEIHERFQPDLAPLGDLCADLIDFRSRIETLRLSKCHRPQETILDRPHAFPYFSSTLAEDAWSRYATGVRSLHSSVLAALRAA